VNQYRNENNKASFDESNVYSLFVYAVKSQIIRDHYHRLLKIFFTILISSLTKQWDKDGIILRIKKSIIQLGLLIA
jgi:hypothetical protein